MSKGNNSGFSLIELSIVLVIMGLLIAGLSSGASLIKNAELRSVMSQAENIRVASNSYFLETGSLAGDDNSSALSTLNKTTLESDSDQDLRGNGNGLIEYINDAGAREGINAWTHMTRYEITNDTYNVLAYTSGNDFSPYVMVAKKNGGYWTFGVETNANFVYLVSAAGVANTDLAGDAVKVTTVKEKLAPDNTAGIMNASDAESFEKRYDDGNSNTGSIRYRTGGSDGFALVFFSVDM